MTLPIKKEKRSSRLQISVEPSIEKALDKAKKELGLDIPQFLRNVIGDAVEELKNKISA